MQSERVHTDVARSAHIEMEYRTGHSQQFGWETSAAIPCQLRFSEEPGRDVERLHQAFDARGFSPLDSDPTSGRDSPHYEGEVCSRDDYKRIRILVFRGDAVRIYPRENEPSVEELGDIIDAIEQGYGAPLRHDPIRELKRNPSAIDLFDPETTPDWARRRKALRDWLTTEHEQRRDGLAIQVTDPIHIRAEDIGHLGGRR